MLPNPLQVRYDQHLAIIQKLDKVIQLLEGGQSKVDDPDKPMSTNVLCEYLNISLPTLYGYVSSAKKNKVGKNNIPFHYYPNSRILYFIKSEIDAWLKTDNRKQ